MGSLNKEPTGHVTAADELMAVAHALEQEACNQYHRLAERMRGEGEHALSVLFESLSRIEAKHTEKIDSKAMAMIGRRPDSALVRWELPENFDEEEARSYLLTPYRALAIAVRNEERAFAFYSYLAAYAENDQVRQLAEEFAKDELDHAAFLRNHAPDIAAMDLFVVPTIGFELVYAFVVVRLDRRDLVRINVTANPTAEWIARQLTEAFPRDKARLYLIRDRDRIFGALVMGRIRAMGIRDKPTAPASPWQNSFAERLIGSIRRECVDHFIALGEVHLRRILRAYARYYNNIRTHRSLDKDAPVSRPVQRTGIINSRLILGGLHHRYVRV